MFRYFPTIAIAILTLFSKGFAANSESEKQATNSVVTTPDPTPATPVKSDKIVKNATKEQSDAELILLSGLPLTKGVEATQSYVRISIVKSDLIEDSTLKQWVRLALSKIADHPETAAAIREEHLIRVGDYYLNQAFEAEKLNKIPEAYKIAQIAVRVSPGNSKAKLLLANILNNNYGRTDDAIKTLRRGLDYLNTTDTLGRDYLERYFQLLQSIERDDEVIEQSLLMLKNGKDLPQSTRQTISLAAATSLYWVGRYVESVNIININALDEDARGLLLKARALFDGGKTTEAISCLESKSSQFSGNAKDSIYAQLVRFYLLLGKPKIALSVSNERISLNEKAPFPHLQKLLILDRLGLRDDYDKELQLIAENFSGSSAAMLALANFGAERGYEGLTSTLANVAAKRGFERATFVALHLESLINGGHADEAIAQYTQINAAEKGFFTSNQSIIQALLGVAYHARPKKDDVATKSDRNIGDRYLTEFLKSPNLGPEAYRSVGRQLKAVRANDAAIRVLEMGVKLHPKYSQLKADYIGARILGGATDAYGTRKSISDELEELLKMRRPSPLIWHEALSWLRSEAKLPRDQANRLEKSIAQLSRPDLDMQALSGR
jgi:hypothetical protein